jgi:hypothetical protein
MLRGQPFVNVLRGVHSQTANAQKNVDMALARDSQRAGHRLGRNSRRLRAPKNVGKYGPPPFGNKMFLKNPVD